MQRTQELNQKIHEVDDKYREEMCLAEEAKLKAEQLKAKLLEIQAENAEKQKINQIYALLLELDLSKIKTPELNPDDAKTAITSIQNLRGEAIRYNRYEHDCQPMLTQYENEYTKHKKEAEDLKKLMQGLIMQLNYEIEHVEQELRQIRQASQEFALKYQQESNPGVMGAAGVIAEVVARAEEIIKQNNI